MGGKREERGKNKVRKWIVSWIVGEVEEEEGW